VRNLDRYKDPEKHKEYDTKYHQRWRELNKGKENERHRAYYQRNKERIGPARNAWLKNYRKELKDEVLRVYGGSPPKCFCCGEPIIDFLTIDHVNGNGNNHRKLDSQAVHIYQWLKVHGYPEGYRVLCMNCNWAMGVYGVCPHQKR
jgi:hypothetical protein